jgi:hypothetical protein
MPDRSLLLMQPCNEFNNDYNRFRPRRVQSRFLEPPLSLVMTPFSREIAPAISSAFTLLRYRVRSQLRNF